jgi:hypothetical protein
VLTKCRKVCIVEDRRTEAQNPPGASATRGDERSTSMSQTHRAPTRHYTTPGCYSTLTIAILPLVIYFLQLFGKASSLAACAAGVLVVLKILIEWLHAWHHDSQSAPLLRPTSRPRLVQVQPPLAGCFLCGQIRQLHPYEVSGHRVGICQRCHHCVAVTGRYL